MKRTVALGAAWTASAAAAVGLGFLAVSLVDASASPGAIDTTGTTSSATVPSSAPTSVPAPSTASPSAAPPSPEVPAGASAAGQYATPGGTVFADCASGSPVLAGVPAAGWWVDPSDDLGKMEFENGDDDIDVYVVCVGGAPRFALDDSASASPAGASASSSSSSPAPSSPGAGSGRDDSDGRVGGGHGSDDGPGDDSSGRDGGGHGSDD